LKKILKIAAVVCAFALALSGCKGDTTVERADGEAVVNPVVTIDDVTIRNFDMPEKGEKIAVIKVKDFGTIKVKLFPEAAKKGVENFEGLANMGYYNELIFHRVIKDFMDQTGDPRGDGTGGQSMWGGDFDGGIPDGLYHFTGAVAYANTGTTSTSGSQFYIVNTEAVAPSFEGLDPMPKNVYEKYKEVGGVPYLDGSYTVFGQVFEGIDVVRAIGATPTDPETDKPLTQVLIETLTIEEYQG
jgi:cyclophilin family peptidyl-prolyl cis-trans isomerase